MRVPKLPIALALVLSIAGCDNDKGGNQLSNDTNLAEGTADDDAVGMNQSGSDAQAEPMNAAEFANAVAASDLFEIESAKLAAAKAGSAQIKAFARHLRTDHEKSSADLKAAAAKASPPVTATPALDGAMQGMLNELRATDGADFDRRFIDQQTNAHQKALALLQSYVGAGKSQPLKDFASKSIATIEAHLELLNSIRK